IIHLCAGGNAATDLGLPFASAAEDPLCPVSARPGPSARRHHLVAGPTERDQSVVASFQAYQKITVVCMKRKARPSVCFRMKGELHMPMIRLRELSRPCLALMATIGAAIAQDAAPPPPEGELGQL